MIFEILIYTWSVICIAILLFEIDTFLSTFKSDLSKEEREEVTKPDDLDFDEIARDNPTVDVEVNIAIVGNSGSGRSSFVNVILGFKKNDKNAARKAERSEMSSKTASEPRSYSHPKIPNINFWLLPSLDTSGITVDNIIYDLKLSRYDAILIFIDGEHKVTKKHVEVAKKANHSKKPFFFILTTSHPEKEETVFDESERTEKKKRGEFDLFTEVFDCRKYKIYFINYKYPFQWDFSKLGKAVVDELLSLQKKEKFCMIPMMSELVAMEHFHDFVKEYKEETNLRKLIPNLAEIKQFFTGDGIVGVQRMINEKLDEWKTVKINLAILGNSGTGKSSFINAIREVDTDDELAAKTGIKETTKVPTPFKHPTNEKILFWDLPGIATPNYASLEVFCKKMEINMYDTFLIVCANRFTINDFKLAKKVESMKKSFFFVRTKIDQDLDGEREKKAFNEEETLNEIKDDCAKNLEDLKEFDENDIFLVSNKHLSKWDFDRLKKAISDQLPLKQKESLIFSMRSHSEVLVDEKIQLLKGRVWMTATASVMNRITFGLSSYLFGIDGELIRERVKFYRNQLEFPESNSKEFKMLSKDLQKRVKKFYPPENDEDYLEWMKSFDPDNTITKKPIAFVHRMLNAILDEMEKTALSIIIEAATQKTDQ